MKNLKRGVAMIRKIWVRIFKNNGDVLKSRLARVYIIVLFSLLPLFNSCEEEVELTDYFLIYDGDAADEYGVEALADLADEMGYDVKYISNLTRLSGNLDEAAVFMIGGTILIVGALFAAVILPILTTTMRRSRDG